MSFPKLQNLIKKKTKDRKEKDSSLQNEMKITCPENPTQKERTSTFASRGSMTLEAALVVPIFFFAMLALVYLLEMMSIRMTVHHALHSVGREIAQAAYTSPMISAYGIKQHMIQNIGKERLDKSIIVGGAEGLDCSQSRSDWNTAVITLSVSYNLEIPVLMFRIPLDRQEDEVKVKGWTGYAAGEVGDQDREVVYVTDHGLVYHKDLSCTYLALSVRAVNREEMETLRNQSGGKYDACQYCKADSGGNVCYVTDYGESYHTSLDCSRLKRNIYAVPLEEASMLGGCSKCVK